jgi:chemotaxis protein histidine kinase CheA/CheY-like chemotaxis protein
MSVHLTMDNPLKALREELALTLQRVQSALETYLDNPGAVAPLESLATDIDQVGGAFAMLERPEVAALAREIAALARELAHGERENGEAVQSVLLRAVLQLSPCLEWLPRDSHPPASTARALTNELRAVRDLPPLSAGLETTICLTDPAPARATVDLRQLAIELRPPWQRALLGVLRGQAVSTNLQAIAQCFRQLQAVMPDASSYRFWWLAEGLVEELLDGGIPLTPLVHSLLRDVDNQVRYLSETGQVFSSSAAEQTFSQRLSDSLAGSSRGLARLQNQTGYAPPPDSAAPPADLPATLTPPDNDTFQQLAGLLQESLARVEDAVERFAYARERRDELPPVAAGLHALANVLLLLQGDMAAGLLQEAEQRVHQWVATTDVVAEESLFQFASELVLVEGSLHALSALACAPDSAEATAEPLDAAGRRALLLAGEHQRSTLAVIQEAVQLMRQARELAATALESKAAGLWDRLRTVLHDIGGALALLECEPVTERLQRLEGVVCALASQTGLREVQQGVLDAFAEITLSLEYDLELLGEGKALNGGALSPLVDQQLNRIEALLAAPLFLPPVQEAAALRPSFELTTAAAGSLEPLGLSLPLPAGTAGEHAAGTADPEMRALFFEEAQGELANIRANLAVWRNDLTDSEALLALRRSFHTLKGSGRLVQQTAIGNFAGYFETLLNEVRDGRLAPSLPMAEVVEEAQRVLRPLVGEGRCDGSEATVMAALTAQVEVLLRGGILPAGGPVSSGPAVAVDTEAKPLAVPPVGVPWQAPLAAEQPLAATPEPQGVPAEVDAELVEIFGYEAAEILDASDRLLEHWQAEPANDAWLNELRRAMHTLKGSARMAGFMGIGDLAHAMEAVLDKLSTQGVQDTRLLADALQGALDRLNSLLAEVRRDGEITPASDLIRDLRALVGEPVTVRTLPPAIQRQDAAEPAAAVHDAPARATPAALTGLERDEEPAGAAAVTAGEPVHKPLEKAPAPAAEDTIRVSTALLNRLVNDMGESSICRARVDQGLVALRFNLAEMDQTVYRLRQQLRHLEIETEAQISSRYKQSAKEQAKEFDPLELDRFSELQQLSRSLLEVVDDLTNIKSTLEDQAQEMNNLLDQQAKVNKEIQQGLMRTRLVRFNTVEPRWRRVVRQAAQELGKRAELLLEGAESEVDRTVLENMVAPLEHMLRNALSHGIEMPEQRRAAGKPEVGTITLALRREGAELVLNLQDDGAGLNFAAIRAKGEALGLLTPGQAVTQDELIALVLRPGFTTVTKVTQISGRGVGLDVLNDAIKVMRGALLIQTEPGKGTNFVIRLPFSLAVTPALLVQVGTDIYAVPLLSIESVARLDEGELHTYLAGASVEHQFGKYSYPLHNLGVLVGAHSVKPYAEIVDKRPPILLFRNAEASAALQVDAVLGNQEIIVKPLGPQFQSLTALSGATVLGDGRVVVVLDLAALVRNLNSQWQRQAEARALDVARHETRPERIRAMVIDDSITMRKVTGRFLERHNISVTLAKDGLEAVAKLEEQLPDLVILDIEMPRMDGFELAAHIRNQPHLQHIPIIMVTSRGSEKHRERAAKLGVNAYLTKPYQEEEMLNSIRTLLGERAAELSSKTVF